MLTKLGKYEIRRELGRGAMGIVYEGFDPYIERAVALKTVLKSIIDNSEAEEAFNRFRREAQAAGRLTHPNIVSVYEYGEDNDVAFIAMEFITGKELKELFDKGERFPLKECVRIMQQLLSALDYAHAHGVVHRDIKPANIVIAQDSHIKVVDFGIARIESSELTQVGTVMGTPTYMSPEQFMGLTVDGRSDIYSAGVILYQFLTGERPFTGNMATMMQKVLNQPPVPPSTHNPDIAKALEDVVLKAMAKRPEERFQNAAEFLQALNQATGAPAPAANKTADADATVVADATMVTGSAQQNAPTGPATSSSLAGFDLSALMADIAGTAAPMSVPQQAAAALGAVTAEAYAEGESTLLTRLAREAQEKMPAVQEGATAAQIMQADQTSRRRRLHEALASLEKFLVAFALHVNKVEPAISRIYRIGRQRVYSNLVCKNAFAEGRKLDLTETALLDFVMFGARLWAPKQAMITWPWDQKDELKEQLQKMKLKALDDLDLIASKKPRQEWLEVNLAPDFPMLLKFKGNYDAGRIDVQAMNLDALGFATFKLGPEDVTQALMDDIGLFLLGRADKLPEALRRA